MPFALPVGRVRRARQRLRDEHNLLDVLLDSVEVAMVACATDGRLTHVNRRTRELMAGQCAAGMDVASWIGQLAPRTPSGLPLVLEDLPLMRALAGEVVRGFDVLVSSAAGDVLLSMTANPVNDERGRRRGAVAVFEDVTEQRARELRIRTELRHMGVALEVEDAINAGRLLLHSQPIVAIASGEIVLEELLVRMRSVDGKLSGPAGFLAATERHSTITALDRWVFEQAVQIAAQGRSVTVNVSARTVGTLSFLEVVEETLTREGIEPSLITFELTETAVVSDIVQATRFAERLEAIGCHFALDDFGTGYAALTYLKLLPIRYLKIDMDFVRDLVENPRSRAVVSGIVALAAGCGQSTIAEGVEDAATLALLGELGVDLAQGFHLGRPGPIDADADSDSDADPDPEVGSDRRADARAVRLSPPTLP
jgi:EAL domain-containing protein (putative c-di-GMP-specific phosphodiesterase class I)